MTYDQSGVFGTSARGVARKGSGNKILCCFDYSNATEDAIEFESLAS